MTLEMHVFVAEFAEIGIVLIVEAADSA